MFTDKVVIKMADIDNLGMSNLQTMLYGHFYSKVHYFYCIAIMTIMTFRSFLVLTDCSFYFYAVQIWM